MNELTIFEAIRRNVLVVVPEVAPESVVLDCTLIDLGLNSLDRTDVLILTLEELGITVPVHEFHRGDTIATVVTLMGRHA
jgi:polyketide biosynthesis acyl carrier protein